MKRLARSMPAVLVLAAAGASAAPPLPSLRHPLVTLYGLPVHAEAELPARGEWRTGVVASLTSSAALQAADGEALTLDGETTRIELGVDYGLPGGFALDLTVPFVRHDGGFMDGLIEGWHDLFGLPNGSRDQLPDDALSYRYADAAGTLLALESSAGGLGDVELGLSRALWTAGHRRLVVRAAVELPSGDADELTGSGSTDWNVALAWQDLGLADGRLRFSAVAGLAILGDGEILAERQRDDVLYGRVRLGWRAWRRLELEADLGAHSAVYDSAIRQLGTTAWQLGVGASWPTGRAGRLYLGFTEDVRPDTGPDFGVFLGWRSGGHGSRSVP